MRRPGWSVGVPGALGTYRIYRVGPAGRLVLGEAFEAKDDAAAIERARSLHDAMSPAELWEGGRLVGRFSKLGVFTPGAG